LPIQQLVVFGCDGPNVNKTIWKNNDRHKKALGFTVLFMLYTTHFQKRHWCLWKRCWPASRGHFSMVQNSLQPPWELWFDIGRARPGGGNVCQTCTVSLVNTCTSTWETVIALGCSVPVLVRIFQEKQWGLKILFFGQPDPAFRNRPALDFFYENTVFFSLGSL